jgi:hypothetical protein
MSRQWIRLLDVFILGPFMIWYALTSMHCEAMSAPAALALLISGVLTIVYNGVNWLTTARVRMF